MSYFDPYEHGVLLKDGSVRVPRKGTPVGSPIQYDTIPGPGIRMAGELFDPLEVAVDLPGFSKSSSGLNSADSGLNRKIRGIRKMIEANQPGAVEALMRLQGVQLPRV